MRTIRWLPALCALGAAAAGAQAPAAADPGWGVSVGAVHRRLVERADNGNRLLTESGPMLRLALDGQLRLAGGGALRAAVGVTSGRLDYDGQTQAGVPITTDSSHRDLDFDLGWRPLAPAAWGEGWLVLHAVQQRRQIASTPTAGGLRETSILWMPGVRWSHAFAAGGWQWQPSVELRASVAHDLEVDYGGVFDTSDLEGGRRREVVLGLQATAAGSPWQWSLEWSHARQSASPRQVLYRGGAAVGTVRQPRIGIDDVSLRVRRAF